MNNRLAYVVPTKDRPDDLRVLLTSIRGQTEQAFQIIIVDGSDDPIDHVLADFRDLPITYERVRPPSLARQRNVGMALVDPSVVVAGYLDDDLELEPTATEMMARFWASAGPEVGGAAFSIVNQPSQTPALVDRLFLLNSRVPGRLLRSGYASSIPFVERTIETDWLYGGATMWRREVIDAFAYDEWYVGHGYLEDVDFSNRVSDHYALFVVGDARVHHWSPMVRVDRLQGLGRQEIANRVYFARKRHRTGPALVWAMAGRVMLNIAAAARRRDRNNGRRLVGNVQGLWAVARGDSRAVGGSWK